MPNAPIGVTVIVVLTLVGLALFNQERRDHATYQAARHGYELSKQTVPEDVAAHRPYTADKPYREEWRAEQDLEAQRMMAWWSKVAGLAASIGVFLLAMTLWETTRTTVAAAEAADATRKGVELAEKTAERQLRAYLSITSMDLHRDGDTYKLKTVITNDGQTPARGVRPSITMGIRTLAGENLPEIETDEAAAVVGPGKIVTNEVSLSPTAGELAHIASGDRTIFAWGRVDYVDIFGTKRFLTVRCRMGSERGPNSYAMRTLRDGNDAN